jgi:hypothetical protein
MTILGGIAAIWFFWEKFKPNKQWVINDKIVSSNWFDSSEIKKDFESQGYSFRWFSPDKIEERIQKGYVVIYEEDKSNMKRNRFVNKSGQILIGKP